MISKINMIYYLAFVSMYRRNNIGIVVWVKFCGFYKTRFWKSFSLQYALPIRLLSLQVLLVVYFCNLGFRVPSPVSEEIMNLLARSVCAFCLTVPTIFGAGAISSRKLVLIAVTARRKDFLVKALTIMRPSPGISALDPRLSKVLSLCEMLLSLNGI